MGGADAEFVEYVRGRQQALLRATYLVCGDPRLAEELLESALVRLASDWSEVRDDRPDAYVRRVLFRSAVAVAEQRAEEAPSAAPPEPVAPWDAETNERRLDVLRALDTLTPRQRATIVLRLVEDRTEQETADALGVEVAAVRADTDDAVTRLQAALPRVDLGHGGAP